jgi:hypothetical protein
MLYERVASEWIFVQRAFCFGLMDANWTYQNLSMFDKANCPPPITTKSIDPSSATATDHN